MGWNPEGIAFKGPRSTPIYKDLTDGGWVMATSTGPGLWHFVEAQGWRHWLFVLEGSSTLAGTFSVNIEGTDDRGRILTYAGGAMRYNGEGHADAATIVPFTMVTGMTGLGDPQEFDRQVVAVRANLTANSISAGTLYVNATVEF